MADPNLFASEWELDATDAPMRGRAVRLGAAAGARSWARRSTSSTPAAPFRPTTSTTATRSCWSCSPGARSVRTVDGVRRLEPGAVVAFVRGPDGAHRVFNDSDEAARVLLVSTMNLPEVAVHLTTGAVLTLTAPGVGQVVRRRLRLAGVLPRAMAADAEGTSTT